MKKNDVTGFRTRVLRCCNSQHDLLGHVFFNGHILYPREQTLKGIQAIKHEFYEIFTDPATIAINM